MWKETTLKNPLHTYPLGETTMTNKMTFNEMMKEFNYDLDRCLEYIDNAVEQGLVEISCNTLPVYVHTGTGSYDQPLFSAKDDWQPNVAGYTMYIENWYEDDDSSETAEIVFEFEDIEWFEEHIWPEHNGIIENSELYWNDSELRRRFGLLLQLKLVRSRLLNAKQYLRQFITELKDDQLHSHCKAIAEMVEEEKVLQRGLEWAWHGNQPVVA